ncbi:MAG TPA: DUF885 domain-containing protein [Vicinamibacterales bacterium]|nr:DUF885 domain-containing protein [Vicinamibacterales bacterium]
MRASTHLIAVLLIAAAACGRDRTPPPPDTAAIDAIGRQVNDLADAYVTSFFDAFPYNAVTFGAEDRHPDRLADHSLAALAKWQAREDELSRQLRAIDAARLEGRSEAITYKFLRHLLESSQRYRTCRMELWNVSPTYTGWQSDLAVAAGQQPVATDEQRRHALARFSQVPKFIDDEIANLQEGVKLGYLAPKNNVRVVIEQMDALLAAKVADSPFVQMAPADAAEFRSALERLETTGIRPAIRRYRDYLRNTYLAAARDAIGVSANPSGSACYTAAVNYFATIDMSPQQIHDLGRTQMEKILAEMRTIGGRSFGTSDPAKLLILAKNDPKYRFKSREELIAYAEAAIERAKAALPKYFGRVPKAPVVVEPYPPYLEKSAPAGQAVPPTADGKPGKYLINAYRANEQSKAGLESTAFHEAYPGHHMQAAIALERTDLHRVSRYFFLSGFGEGWGLYAERLADEMGLFSSDLDRLGLLSNEALRAARLVVDAGMHGLGWSRQQAVDYLLSHTTETAARANAEIDRYIAVPGQATAYMIGNLEIRRLRTEAEQKLGAKFDLREFHDLVLQDGTVPLRALGEKVARWMAGKQ